MKIDKGDAQKYLEESWLDRKCTVSININNFIPPLLKVLTQDCESSIASKAPFHFPQC